MATALQIALLSGTQNSYPGASVALDFAGVNGLGPFYKANGVIAKTFAGLPGLTINRASGGYAEDVNGNLVWFNSGQARITNKGLLVEEARTNLIKWSDDTSNAVWVDIATGTMSETAGTPLTYGTIGRTGAATSPGLRQQTFSAVSGTTYAYSVRLAAGTATIGAFGFFDGSNFKTYSIDLTTGVITAQTGSGTVVSVASRQVSDGWIVNLVFTSTATNAAANVSAGVHTGQTGTVQVRNFQLEAGAFPTSYIPATSSAQPRAADDIRLGGMSFLNGMTGLVDAISTGTTSNPRVLFHQGVGQPAVFVSASSTSVVATIGAVADASPTLNAAIGQFRTASSFVSGAELSSANGVTGGTGAVAYTPAASTLYVGQQNDQTRQFNGYIRALVLYPSALSQAQLNALTSGTDPSTLRLDFASGVYKNAAGYVRTNYLYPTETPTAWATSSTTNGVTVTQIATGIESGLAYSDYRWQGTSSGVASDIRLGTTTYAASSGQTWTAAYSAKIIAGSMPTGGVLKVALIELTSVGAYVAETTPVWYPTLNNTTITRSFSTRTLGGTAGKVQLSAVLGFSNGVAVDITIRIYAPQLEQSNYPSSFIPTTSSTSVSTTTYSSTNPADVGNLTFTRASTSYGTDSQGNLILFGANVPVITNRGLQVEESRTNLFPYSFDDTPANIWTTLSNATISTGTLTPRAVGATVTRLTSTSTAGRIQRNFTVANDSAARVFAVDVEKKSTTYEISIGIVNGTTVSTVLQFNGATGSVISGTGTIEDRGLWWRVSVVVTNNSTGNTTLYTYVQASVGNGGTADIALPDLQTGTFATSYIPSRAGASATRAADVMSYAGSYGQTQTLAIQYFMGSGTDGLFRLSPVTFGKYVGLAAVGAGNTGWYANGLTSFPISTANQTNAAALVTDTGGVFKASRNGGAVVSSSASDYTGGATSLDIGVRSTAGPYLNDVISRFALYGYAANDTEITYRSAGNF